MQLREMKKRVRNAMPGREKALMQIALPVRKKGLVRKRMLVRKQKLLMRLMTVAGIALLLNACAKPQTGCNSVSCRPQSDLHKLTIWWQPELRNGPYDFTQVPVNN